MQIKLILLITSLTFIVFSKLLRCSGKVKWLTSYDNEEYKNMTENTRLEIALKYSKIISIPSVPGPENEVYLVLSRAVSSRFCGQNDTKRAG